MVGQSASVIAITCGGQATTADSGMPSFSNMANCCAGTGRLK
jgi:hypothetical protein